MTTIILHINLCDVFLLLSHGDTKQIMERLSHERDLVEHYSPMRDFLSQFLSRDGHGLLKYYIHQRPVAEESQSTDDDDDADVKHDADPMEVDHGDDTRCKTAGNPHKSFVIPVRPFKRMLSMSFPI